MSFVNYLIPFDFSAEIEVSIEDPEESIVSEIRAVSINEFVAPETNSAEVQESQVEHHEEVSENGMVEESTVADKENRQSEHPTTPAAGKKSVKVEE